MAEGLAGPCERCGEEFWEPDSSLIPSQRMSKPSTFVFFRNADGWDCMNGLIALMLEAPWSCHAGRDALEDSVPVMPGDELPCDTGVLDARPKGLGSPGAVGPRDVLGAVMN